MECRGTTIALEVQCFVNVNFTVCAQRQQLQTSIPKEISLNMSAIIIIIITIIIRKQIKNILPLNNIYFPESSPHLRLHTLQVFCLIWMDMKLCFVGLLHCKPKRWLSLGIHNPYFIQYTYIYSMLFLLDGCA